SSLCFGRTAWMRGRGCRANSTHPRGLEPSYDTVTLATGSSATSAIVVSAAASACCGAGSGAFLELFFAANPFVRVLVPCFFGAFLAATCLDVLVRAVRLDELPRFSVALRAAPRFFR